MRAKYIRAMRTIVCIACAGQSAVANSSELKPVSKPDLCVTEGEIGTVRGGWLAVDVPKMRAYLDVLTPPFAEVHFKYLGSTGNEKRLGSGELRRQFGLKLRAQDACNLVYAMWRIEPESKLVVSVKMNPGEHSSAQCGNRGCRNIKPRHSRPIPHLRPGDDHTLHAEMNGEELRVFVDKAMVWEGVVGRDALSFEGPVGIRSDNAHLEFELRSAPASKSQSGSASCKVADSD